MKNKKDKIGLYIGRFQPFHKGHLNVVEEALNHCDKLIIAIGSAQEFGTEKNPFSFDKAFWIDFVFAVRHADSLPIWEKPTTIKSSSSTVSPSVSTEVW